MGVGWGEPQVVGLHLASTASIRTRAYFVFLDITKGFDYQQKLLKYSIVQKAWNEKCGMENLKWTAPAHLLASMLLVPSGHAVHRFLLTTETREIVTPDAVHGTEQGTPATASSPAETH